MGDFDRFKLRKARSRRNKIRTTAFNNLRKKSSRNGSLYGRKCKGGDKPKPKKEAKKKVAGGAAPAQAKAAPAAKQAKPSQPKAAKPQKKAEAKPAPAKK